MNNFGWWAFVSGGIAAALLLAALGVQLFTDAPDITGAKFAIAMLAVMSCTSWGFAAGLMFGALAEAERRE